MSITIAPVTSSELPALAPTLAELLIDAVEGATLGFMEPVAYADAHAYWLNVAPELDTGSRIMLVAREDDRVVGTGQLVLAQMPNARHRAEVQKLFVSRSLRGRGVGRHIMSALHDVARAHGRSLILLNTRAGSPAESFYRALEYTAIGVIPGYAMGAAGERYDSVRFYKEL
jgi:GNAT superfamily N-acetyltransferase